MPGLFVVLVGLVTLGGLLLRLPSFHQSLFGDEISTYYIVNGHSLGRVLQLVQSDQETTPPLFFILAWATKGLLGNQVQSIRLVSLVTGTAAIPLTFVLGVWTVGRRAALVGATLMALCPFMIFFSTEARPYMLVLFLALVSTFASCGRSTPGTLGLVAGLRGLLVCRGLHPLHRGVPAGGPTGVGPVGPSPSPVGPWSRQPGGGLAYLPWLGGLRADLHAPNYIGGLQAFGIGAVASDVESWWIGQPYIVPLKQMPGDLAVALAVAGLARGSSAWPAAGDGTLDPEAASSCGSRRVLAAAPAVMMALYSWIRVDVWESRNLIASWPGLAVAMGALVMFRESGSGSRQSD